MPLSYLNQLAYCPRRFWYMYVHGELEINAPMLEGTFQHQTRADKPARKPMTTGVLPTAASGSGPTDFNIAGFADFVETIRPNAKILIPVEYKHGQQGKWDNDQIQLCAQVLVPRRNDWSNH
ncbi:MAG: Dna2/Cas4 domain-containing protein [bacterium]|nr:Dna2/Cas4 domain-containing protein [bacterium]